LGNIFWTGMVTYMKRKIIVIDESKCDGCGLCAQGCPEGALQVIDGKAKLVAEMFCDGLGACVGGCPRGAISVETRQAEPYDERRTMDNIVKGGAGVIKAHLAHLKSHGDKKHLAEAGEYLKEHNIPVPVLESSGCGCHSPAGGGCPGGAIHDNRNKTAASGKTVSGASELRQWPIQLHLLNPYAPYFENADLLVAADCTAFSFGAFHPELLKGKSLVIFCPKLDNAAEDYVEKLTELFRSNDIKSVTVARMTVPCCGGTTALVREALSRSGKSIKFEEIVISLEGEIQ